MGILDKLYFYQKDVVNITSENDKGIICLPTGTGKTFCEAAVIANDIYLNPKQFRIYVVNAPRIILTYQLLKETYKFLTSNGIDARYMFVHSGGTTDETELENIRTEANNDGYNIPFSEIESTTSVDTIKEIMVKSKSQDLPLVIFSTYNSANKIEIARKDMQNISIILNDEAHYLVQEHFHDILNTLTSNRCYFFTATMVYTPSDKGRGMNNAYIYGEVLYVMTPRRAIELGKMVRPRLHIVKTTGVYNIDDYNKSLNKIISESFYQHNKVIKSAAKLLITVKGTEDIRKFIDSDEYSSLREDNVSIYAVSSNDIIGNDINKEKVNRQTFLKRLKKDGLIVDKKIIILHYDILAEGIDVSGFSGIMPLRSLSKSKFLQTFGRSSRLDKYDRIKLANGSLAINDLENFNKPYSYIIIPNIIHSNEDDKSNIIKLITELRDYGFEPYEDIISSSIINGIPEIELLDNLNDIKKTTPLIGEIIEDLEADIESEKNSKLSKIEFLTKNIKK